MVALGVGSRPEAAAEKLLIDPPENAKPMPDHEAREHRIRDEDGFWTALALFVAVLVFLGTAAYLYWWGTGKLPWQ